MQRDDLFLPGTLRAPGHLGRNHRGEEMTERFFLGWQSMINSGLHQKRIFESECNFLSGFGTNGAVFPPARFARRVRNVNKSMVLYGFMWKMTHVFPPARFARRVISLQRITFAGCQSRIFPRRASRAGSFALRKSPL